MLAHVAVLVVSALAASRPSTGAAISTYLAPVDEDVLRGGMRVQVTGCARAQGSTARREIASGEADLSLEAAASMVARELEKLAKRKGRRSGP
jgi:hypothetical protein